MKLWEGTLSIGNVEVFTRGEKCSACGELLFDPPEVERQELELVKAIVARGIRRGNEFKLVRKALGARANEIAELLDVRPETVSRWEHGDMEIPRAAAFALGELWERPQVTRRKLAAFAG